MNSVTTSGTGIIGGNGDLDAGKVVTFTVNLSGAATVTGGTPTLTLSDGATATYTGGSASNALTFSYTVAAGQNAADLTVSAVNLNGASITDSIGNNANLAGAVTNPAGTLQIDTTAPTVSSVTTSGTGITNGSGDLRTGSIVAFTIHTSEAVTVVGGTPTLTLNDGATATFTGGSSSNALTFSYMVATGQNTADLAVAAINLNGATVSDGAGNPANVTGAVTNPAGTLQIDTTIAAVNSVVTSGAGITNGNGDLGTGSVVTLTVNMSEVVNVSSGTPRLTLNDGATATYSGGSGTSALTFSYTVAAGQNTADLAVTAVNLNAATVADGAGNAADITGAVVNPAGTLQINTIAPGVTSVTTSGAGITNGSGDLGTGGVVTFTVNLSEAVTVTGGTPTLTLNDGATATYTGGSGSNALTFSYTVATGQNTADLAVAAIHLNGATVTDGAGNSADFTGAVVNPTGTLQIDTTTGTWVERIYNAIDHRAATSAEVATSLSLNATLGSASTVATVVNSTEAKTYDYPIVQIILLATGNLPTATQLEGWLPLIQSGTSLEQMALAFVASTQFGNTYNGGTPVDPNAPITSSIVSAIIQNALGVAPTAAQVQAWVDTGMTIDQVFVKFALGAQYSAAIQPTVQQFLTQIANQAGAGQITYSTASGNQSSPMSTAQIEDVYQTILQRQPNSTELTAAQTLSTTGGNTAVVSSVITSARSPAERLSDRADCGARDRHDADGGAVGWMGPVRREPWPVAGQPAEQRTAGPGGLFVRRLDAVWEHLQQRNGCRSECSHHGEYRCIHHSARDRCCGHVHSGQRLGVNWTYHRPGLRDVRARQSVHDEFSSGHSTVSDGTGG